MTMNEIVRLNKDYWINRYKNNETGWDLGKISPPIKNWFDKQKNKKLRILVPGSGYGHEVIYGYKSGFKNIFYMDFADDATKKFKTLCPKFPETQIIKSSFFNYEPKKKFDIIIEHTFFCAQHPGKRIDYVDSAYKVLNKKGKLIGLLFNTEFQSNEPPFGGNVEDYKLIFNKKFELLIMEDCKSSIKPRLGSELWIEFIRK